MADDPSDEQSTDETSTTDGSQGDRAAARSARGLPDSVDQLTDEQRHEYIGQPTVEAEAENAEQAEVLAMQDTGSGSGEEVA